MVDFVIQILGDDGTVRTYTTTAASIFVAPTHVPSDVDLRTAWQNTNPMAPGALLLEPGTTYTWSVTARNAGGSTTSNATFTFTAAGSGSRFLIVNPHRNLPYYSSGQLHTHTYNAYRNNESCVYYMIHNADTIDQQPYGEIVHYIYADRLGHEFIAITDHWPEWGVTHYDCPQSMVGCFEGKEVSQDGRSHWLLVGSNISTDTSTGWPAPGETTNNLTILSHPGYKTIANEWYYTVDVNGLWGLPYDGWEVPGDWKHFDVAEEIARLAGKSYWIFKNDDFHPTTTNDWYDPSYQFCGGRHGWNVVNSQNGTFSEYYTNLKAGNFFAVEILDLTRNSPWASAPGAPFSNEEGATNGITIKLSPFYWTIEVNTGTTADRIEFVASGRNAVERPIVGAADNTNFASYLPGGGERYVQVKIMKTVTNPMGDIEYITIYSQPILVYGYR